MRKTVLFFVMATVFVMASCQENKKATLRTSIHSIDDSLRVMVKKEMNSANYQMDKSMYKKAIDANIKFYSSYPTDKYADTALHKVAALYRQLGESDNATKWRDTLLEKFPNTYRKEGLLELQMNYYDLNHYNPTKIKYYIGKLLAMDHLSKEKREQFEFRLKHIDLTFDQLIQLQTQMDKKQEDSIPKQAK